MKNLVDPGLFTFKRYKTKNILHQSYIAIVSIRFCDEVFNT